MLEAIFSSATRVKILNLLLLGTARKFQLTELARDLDLPANSVRHELDNLVRFGLLNEETALKKRYFNVNPGFILYPEIKALFAKAQILSSQKFILGLRQICQPKFLALTGLFTNYPEAQTDLLVVGNVRRPAFLKLMKELEHDLGREINFTIMTEREFRYREEIMDIFLYNILTGKTLVLIDRIHQTESL
ncbi:MAG: winged helix-turn-helix domain-containing protein [Patescibacteria group bacterium]